MIATYRARIAEVRAIDCDDGRYLLLTEPPHYLPLAEFLAAYELVEERRVVGRRGANGKRRPKRKPVRRKSAGRRERNGDRPEKMEARRLFEREGKRLKEISDKLKLKYQTVYGWSKKESWKAQAPATPRSAAAAPRPSATTKKADSGDDSWMQ